MCKVHRELFFVRLRVLLIQAWSSTAWVRLIQAWPSTACVLLIQALPSTAWVLLIQALPSTAAESVTFHLTDALCLDYANPQPIDYALRKKVCGL